MSGFKEMLRLYRNTAVARSQGGVPQQQEDDARANLLAHVAKLEERGDELEAYWRERSQDAVDKGHEATRMRFQRDAARAKCRELNRRATRAEGDVRTMTVTTPTAGGFGRALANVVAASAWKRKAREMAGEARAWRDQAENGCIVGTCRDCGREIRDHEGRNWSGGDLYRCAECCARVDALAGEDGGRDGRSLVSASGEGE